MYWHLYNESIEVIIEREVTFDREQPELSPVSPLRQPVQSMVEVYTQYIEVCQRLSGVDWEYMIEWAKKKNWHYSTNEDVGFRVVAIRVEVTGTTHARGGRKVTEVVRSWRLNE